MKNGYIPSFRNFLRKIDIWLVVVVGKKIVVATLNSFYNLHAEN